MNSAAFCVVICVFNANIGKMILQSGHNFDVENPKAGTWNKYF